MSEHKRVSASMKSGSGEEDVYKPILWYFKNMQFILNNGHEPRFSIDSMDGTEFTDQYEEAESQETEETFFVKEAADGSVLVDDTGNEIYVDVQSPSTSSGSRTDSTFSAKPGKKRKRVAVDTEEQENRLLKSASTAVENIAKYLEQPINSNKENRRGECDIFGEFVGQKLKSIANKYLRSEAQSKIMQLLDECVRQDEN
ncbi:uncharacterized protein LOC116169019 [Photinus pyralis]|uniref:uncharacterized protein LOC116169019 n=1 Tax=Photinus pyralis TaxID=7054 RepID=UPI0012670B25|nr:uncharacterized protein LOC116169019 [Photinus pyralis]